ncbi:MAG: 2-hydroxyacid dehydrogenase [Clostridia bacterium]|nr:2-hydroxyacid dehydrogenase [Clostridia bacterium]
MPAIAFFDAKTYDRASFDLANDRYEIRYFESRLTLQTAKLASGCEAVCAFVNDEIDGRTVGILADNGVKVLAMRCAGYSNVDLKAAEAAGLTVVRVPAYSPHAVAEHAMGLLMAVNRRLHKAYGRTREFNFNIAGLTGVDLYGKTAGVIGTGKIGRAFMDICRGFGMRVLAYDPYPALDAGIEYVSLEELLERSDVISLHCPLTEDSWHLLDADAFARMKKGVFIINTSRGALLDSTALLDALNSGKVRGAGLDVYEEESGYFFKDHSEKPIRDDVLALLVSRPNVLLTSHQAFLTEEALSNIAATTLENLDDYFAGRKLINEVRAGA